MNFELILASVFVNNIVLIQFLGLCPFMGVSNKYETAIGMGIATTFVLTLSSVSSYLIQHYILIPLEAEYLKTLFFILVIAGVVQFTEIFIRKVSPLLHNLLGIYLPLITTNCAVLGVALLNTQQQHNFMQSLSYGLGSAIGFTLVLVLFSGCREQLKHADVPEALQGAPIALITAGLMSIAFTGFSGMAN